MKKVENFKWYSVSDILPEECDFERYDSNNIKTEFLVYFSDESFVQVASRFYEDYARGWYWEFGIMNLLGDDDTSATSNRVTHWMVVPYPNENA